MKKELLYSRASHSSNYINDLRYFPSHEKIKIAMYSYYGYGCIQLMVTTHNFRSCSTHTCFEFIVIHLITLKKCMQIYENLKTFDLKSSLQELLILISLCNSINNI